MNVIIIILIVFACILAIYISMNILGYVFILRGQKPFDEQVLKKEGGKYVNNEQGRKIEYFTYGSTVKDAPVVFNIHGSGLEARFEKDQYATICKELEVRGIAISLPGMGYTDMKTGRAVIDWPEEDLLPILKKERVHDFYITGHSQGVPHAMAAACFFQERCKGLGLNAPPLPNDISHEIAIKNAIGSETLPTTKQLKKPWMTWYFVVFYCAIDVLSPWLPLKYIFASNPRIKEERELVSKLKKSFRRSIARGFIGNTWESAKDVCYHWDFDPRLVETNNICIWHAKDDAQCPPEIGVWLAEYYSKKGLKVDFRNDDTGLGHFTYCHGEFLRSEKSMIKTLLNNT